MPLEEIDIGSAINAGDGEAIRNAFAKVNAMMAEIYGFLAPNGFNPDFLAANSLVNGKLATMPANSVKANLTGAPASPDNVGYAALKTALGIAPNVSALAGAYTVVAADLGKFFTATGTFTIALAAASTLGSGFSVMVRNAGTGIVTIDPDAAETINGASTLAIYPGETITIICTGTAFVVAGQSVRPLIVAASVASVADIALTLPAEFKSFELNLHAVKPATNAVANNYLGLQFSKDGGSTYLNSGYAYAMNFVSSTGSGRFSTDTGPTTRAVISAANAPAAASNHASRIVISEPGSATSAPMVLFQSVTTEGSIAAIGGATIPGASRATNVKVLFALSNLANAEYELYGLRA